MQRMLLAAMCIAAATGISASAATHDLVVGNIETPNLRWGVEQASFDITNNSDDIKFIIVETQISFQGEYLNPVRTAHTSYPLEPQFTRTIKPVIDIPGNYGSANLKITIYDVVDTLDELTSGTKVFEQPFFLRFHVPSAVAKYWSERITLPPMVGNSPDFDNEFAHVLPLLLNEGRTPAQIASICECDTSFVWLVIDRLASHGYMYRNADTVRVLFPVVAAKEADELKKLADKTSAEIARILTANLREYPKALDSLVAAKKLDPDTNNFVNTGGLLYQTYPMVAGMALWYDLGQKFVTGTSALSVFYGTDPCHARIPTFMYAVQGGDFYNGTQYFDLAFSSNKVEVSFGDQVPKITCPEDLNTDLQLTEVKDYRYAADSHYEIFLWDTTTMHPALRALTKGAIPALMSVRDKVHELAVSYVQDKFIYGLRYWFWNLTATETLNKLVKSGVVVKRGNGQYRFTTPRKG
jgi:hypothetical protein